MSAPPPNPPLPVTTAPLALPTVPLDSTAGASTGQTPPPSTAPPVAVYSPAEMTGILNDLVTAVQGISLYLGGPYGQPPPLQPDTATGPVALPWYAATTAPIGPLHHHWPGQPPPAVAPTLAAAGGSGDRHTPDASRVRAVAAPAADPTAARCRASMATVAGPGPRGAHHATRVRAAAAAAAGPATTSTEPGSPLQGGVPIQQVRFPPSPSPIPAWLTGSSPPPVYTSARDPPTPTLQFNDPSGSAGHSTGHGHTDRVPQSSLLRTSEPVGHGAPTQTPPRFAKLDFATYDGTEDPPQLAQPVRVVLLPAAHPRLGAYLARLLPPPRRGTDLALACHASGVTAQQRANLFVGGLPDHIRVDVELRGPQDLQTAMYYARAFKRRAVAIQQPYTPDHVCPRLFYLEVADYIEEDAVTADLAAPAVAKVFDAG
nr:formin-like protein 14 [Aegilops tauschii subsp. strangulata]